MKWNEIFQGFSRVLDFWNALFKRRPITVKDPDLCTKANASFATAWSDSITTASKKELLGCLRVHRGGSTINDWSNLAFRIGCDPYLHKYAHQGCHVSIFPDRNVLLLCTILLKFFWKLTNNTRFHLPIFPFFDSIFNS